MTSTALVRRKYWLDHSSPAKTFAPQSSVPETSRGGPVRMIRFVVTQDSLYPRRMQVDQGLFNIALEDETNTSDTLIIESIIGDQRTRVTQIDRGSNQRRGRSLVRLVPGHYLVSLSSQPNYKADLIVRP
jgi:hypothetical protein